MVGRDNQDRGPSRMRWGLILRKKFEDSNLYKAHLELTGQMHLPPSLGCSKCSSLHTSLISTTFRDIQRLKILDTETAIQRQKQREHHNIPRGCSCLNELLAMMIGYNWPWDVRVSHKNRPLICLKLHKQDNKTNPLLKPKSLEPR